MLSANMVRSLHHVGGVIRNPLGCRCETCRVHLDAEAVALQHAGENPDEGREVVLDMVEMWDEETKKRIEVDARLRAFVSLMMKSPDNIAGAAAAHALRTDYAHFLTPPASHDERSDFCVDLAFLTSDIYCRSVIHVEGQTADNYLWWTELYGKVLSLSAVNMPHALTMSLAARAFAYLQACMIYKEEPEALQRKMLDGFMESWIALRMAHIHMFRHPLFTLLVCEAYPLIHTAVVSCQERIRQAELQLRVNMALASSSQSKGGAADAQ